jgi:hypothetical protein
MKINILVVLAATLVPIVIGFVWYNPKFGFGKAWMASSGMTEEKAKTSNMALVFSLTIIFSFILAFVMQGIVIHQFPVTGLLSQQPDFADPASRSQTMLHDLMEHYGHSYRTFKHGAFHGALAGFTIALPIIGTQALFEAKGFKYIAINAGYWIVSMSLMGGVICAFT